MAIAVATARGKTVSDTVRDLLHREYATLPIPRDQRPAEERR